jgi:hypothetical protein
VVGLLCLLVLDLQGGPLVSYRRCHMRLCQSIALTSR